MNTRMTRRRGAAVGATVAVALVPVFASGGVAVADAGPDPVQVANESATTSEASGPAESVESNAPDESAGGTEPADAPSGGAGSGVSASASIADDSEKGPATDPKAEDGATKVSEREDAARPLTDSASGSAPAIGGYVPVTPGKPQAGNDYSPERAAIRIDRIGATSHTWDRGAVAGVSWEFRENLTAIVISFSQDTDIREIVVKGGPGYVRFTAENRFKAGDDVYLSLDGILATPSGNVPTISHISFYPRDLGPVDPVGPVDLVDPADPVDPTDPADPVQPVDHGRADAPEPAGEPADVTRAVGSAGPGRTERADASETSRLARTGADDLAAGGLAAVLVGAGGLALAASRRARRQRD